MLDNKLKHENGMYLIENWCEENICSFSDTGFIS